MSRSGRHHTKEKIQQRKRVEKRKNHPIRLFVRSWDFWGKVALSLTIFTLFIYPRDDKDLPAWIIFYACICLPLLPFAKKCSDDVLRHSLSEPVFEELNDGRGLRGFGTLYLIAIILLVVPLSVGYFFWNIKKHQEKK